MAKEKTKKQTKKPTLKATNLKKAQASKTKVVKKSVEQTKTTKKPKSSVTKKVNFKKYSKFIYTAVGVVAILYGLWYYKSLFVAATVNNVPIFRHQIIAELERQAGPQILEQLVIENLLLQKAEAGNVTVTEEEVNEEVNNLVSNLEQQGQTLTSFLQMRGLSEADLKTQIKTSLIYQKLVEEKVSVTDEEVNAYIEENNEAYAERLSEDEQAVKNEVKEQLTQQQLGMASQQLITELKEQANINYFLFKDQMQQPALGF